FSVASVIHFSTVVGLPNSIRVSRHRSPTSPFAGFETISILSMPLMTSEAFSMLAIAAHVAAFDPLIVISASTSIVFSPVIRANELIGYSDDLWWTDMPISWILGPPHCSRRADGSASALPQIPQRG